MHLDEELVQRLLHGELAPADRERARAHAAGCAACAARMERAAREEAEIDDRLRALDHPAPAIDPARLLPRRRNTPAWARRAAAAVLFAAAAGAAYAAPGSPLRALLARSRAPATPATSSSARAAAPAPTEVAGVTIEAGARLAIELALPAGSEIVVALVDGALASVRVPAGDASFASDEGRLVVRATGGAVRVELDLPRAAPRLDLMASGRGLVRVRGGEVGSTAPARPDGTYRFTIPNGAP